jgi:hypothetical protein
MNDTLSTCGNHATLQKESKIPEAERLARHTHGLAVLGFGLSHAITKLLATVLAGILFETEEEDGAMQLYPLARQSICDTFYFKLR